MIKRLSVKKTVRLLGVQWDGANISECVAFCRYAHYSAGAMYLTIKDVVIRLNEKDWIIHINDKEYITISNDSYKFLFDKAKDAESDGE